MAVGSIIGGLQSSSNPGQNMARRLYRPTRMYRPQTGASSLPPWWRMPTPAKPGKREPGIAHPQPGAATPGATPHPAGPIVPPGGHATGFGAPGASLLTFDQWLASQPVYIAQHAHDVDAQNQLMAQYGFYKDATGHLVADPNANPDSIIAGLGLGREQSIGRTAQQGANRGNLFSGATLLGAQQANEAYRKGAAKALGDLNSGLGDIDQKEIDTKLGLQPDYTDYVGNTKVAKPADSLAKVHAMKPADAVASIDTYLKNYGKYLTPAERQAWQQERARQVNIYNHQKAHADTMAAHRPLPAKATPTHRRKKKRKTRPGGGRNPSVAGGGVTPPNMR